MLFLSVVSCAVALGGPLSQNGLSTPLSPALAKFATERTLTLSQYGVVVGQAVMISPTGEALAPGEAAFGPDGNPRAGLRAAQDGQPPIMVKVESFDPVTDLAMLRIPVSPEEPTKYAELAPKLTSSIVLVMLPTGPVRAQIAQSGIPGVIGTSRRYLPLNEIHLEGNNTALSGAPIFLPDGKLAGMLMASLTNDFSKDNVAMTKENASGKSFAGAAGGGMAPSAVMKVLGPQPSATTFTLDLPVMDRVLSGFISETHEVHHPWVGLFFKTAMPAGAQITQVVLGSPASQAGLREGDVITAAGVKTIASHLELAAYLFNLRVGSVAEFTIHRGDESKRISVKVGTEQQLGSKILRRVGTD